MDADADALYGLPRDEFIARRGDLTKALRKAGRREEAAEVAALRKPSVAAWAVNQLVRTQRSSVQELFEAGDALRAAQSDLLAGQGDGRTLRAAGDRERAAVDELVGRARGLLSSAGDELSPAVIERVADTLHAAAFDEEARAQVRDGQLERELRHVGLGLGPGESGAFAPEPRPPRAQPADAVVSADAPTRGPPPTKRTAAKRDRERAEAERAEADRARRERSAAVKAARSAEVAARRRASAAAKALAAAEARREQAADALSEADEALAAAREDAAGADAEHQRAQAQLDAAERRR